MERVTFTNSRGKTLVGHFYSADSTAIIILAHGFMSDKFSKGRFPRLAEALSRSGFNVLASDFSGCGESDDDSLTVAKQVDDLQSAIRFVQAKGYHKVGLYGHSLGSLICLKSYSPDISAMVLSGALTDAMHYNWEEHFSKEQLSELAEKGFITETRSEGIRKTIIIDRQILLDFETINQEELLKNVVCPVLIIHGNNDEEEVLLCERSKRGMKYLSSDSQLVIIDGAKHNFLDHFDQVVELAEKWFVEHMGTSIAKQV